NLLCLVCLDIVENRSELLTAVARHEIHGTAHERLDGLCDPAQSEVASQVSVAVVVSLEVIDIEHQDGNDTAIQHRLLPKVCKMLVEHPPVFHARERIVLCEVRDEAVFEKASTRAPFEMQGSHRARNHGQSQEYAAVDHDRQCQPAEERGGEKGYDGQQARSERCRETQSKEEKRPDEHHRQSHEHFELTAGCCHGDVSRYQGIPERHDNTRQRQI